MYNLVEVFSCRDGKVSMLEYLPTGLGKELEDKSYMVMAERDGKLSVRKFRNFNAAYEVYGARVADMNPKERITRGYNVLRQRGELRASGFVYNPRPFLQLVAVYNKKFGVYFERPGTKTGVVTNQQILDNYKDAVALYRKIEKHLWGDNLKQK